MLLRGVLLHELMCVRVVLREVVLRVVVQQLLLRLLRPTRRRRHLRLFSMGALQSGRKTPALRHHRKIQTGSRDQLQRPHHIFSESPARSNGHGSKVQRERQQMATRSSSATHTHR